MSMNIGTLACSDILVCSNAPNMKRKPAAEEKSSLWAVYFEQSWQENNTAPINTQPAPIILRSVMATAVAVSFPRMCGNIANVKNSGKIQKAPPRTIISPPFNANTALELWSIVFRRYTILIRNLPVLSTQRSQVNKETNLAAQLIKNDYSCK